MEPERFDDVAFRIVEEPQPPRRQPRRRRWLLTLTACALMTGALAAGASALVGGGGEPRAAPKAGETSTKGWWRGEGWTSYAPDGRGCRKGRHGERERRSQVRH